MVNENASIDLHIFTKSLLCNARTFDNGLHVFFSHRRSFSVVLFFLLTSSLHLRFFFRCAAFLVAVFCTLSAFSLQTILHSSSGKERKTMKDQDHFKMTEKDYLHEFTNIPNSKLINAIFENSEIRLVIFDNRKS